MKYVCNRCGRAFNTYIGCQEHEAGCSTYMAETMQVVQLAFAIGDKGIDVSTREIVKRATLDPTDVIESTDGEGWHVLCMPGDVKKAAKALASRVIEETTRRVCRLMNAKIDVVASASQILSDDALSSRPGGDK